MSVFSYFYFYWHLKQKLVKGGRQPKILLFFSEESKARRFSEGQEVQSFESRRGLSIKY